MAIQRSSTQPTADTGCFAPNWPCFTRYVHQRWPGRRTERHQHAQVGALLDEGCLLLDALPARGVEGTAINSRKFRPGCVR